MIAGQKLDVGVNTDTIRAWNFHSNTAIEVVGLNFKPMRSAVVRIQRGAVRVERELSIFF